MRAYELMVIADGDLEENNVETVVRWAQEQITARGGEVRKISSILPDGKAVEVHPAEPRFYGVEGLFMIIADELAQLGTETPFGQRKGTTAVLRFSPDSRLGYPRRYRRDVLGTPMPLAIDVVRFELTEGAGPVHVSVDAAHGLAPSSQGLKLTRAPSRRSSAGCGDRSRARPSRPCGSPNASNCRSEPAAGARIRGGR